MMTLNKLLAACMADKLVDVLEKFKCPLPSESSDVKDATQSCMRSNLVGQMEYMISVMECAAILEPEPPRIMPVPEPQGA